MIYKKYNLNFRLDWRQTESALANKRLYICAMCIYVIMAHHTEIEEENNKSNNKSSNKMKTDYTVPSSNDSRT